MADQFTFNNAAINRHRQAVIKGLTGEARDKRYQIDGMRAIIKAVDLDAEHLLGRVGMSLSRQGYAQAVVMACPDGQRQRHNFTGRWGSPSELLDDPRLPEFHATVDRLRGADYTHSAGALGSYLGGLFPELGQAVLRRLRTVAQRPVAEVEALFAAAAPAAPSWAELAGGAYAHRDARINAVRRAGGGVATLEGLAILAENYARGHKKLGSTRREAAEMFRTALDKAYPGDAPLVG